MFTWKVSGEIFLGILPKKHVLGKNGIQQQSLKARAKKKYEKRNGFIRDFSYFCKLSYFFLRVFRTFFVFAVALISEALATLCLNLSTRPAVSTNFCLPV